MEGEAKPLEEIGGFRDCGWWQTASNGSPYNMRGKASCGHFGESFCDRMGAPPAVGDTAVDGGVSMDAKMRRLHSGPV